MYGKWNEGMEGKCERLGGWLSLGSDARKRGGCQAGQCLIRDCLNYKESML